MPPSIDIYALTKSRDQETLERFASKYVDRPASEDLGDEQLMIFPIGENGESGEVADWDWEPALNLDHVFQRGLDYPRRAFTIYLKACRPFERAIISFTRDNQLVLGVSLDFENESEKTIELAVFELNRLAVEFEARIGFGALEEPPPVSEERFPENGGGVVCYWERKPV